MLLAAAECSVLLLVVVDNFPELIQGRDGLLLSLPGCILHNVVCCW